MKTVACICLVFGVLSFFGAVLKGNNVFGPLFWIALGAFFIYRVNNKESKQADEPRFGEKVPYRNGYQQIQSCVDIPKRAVHQQWETLENLQSQLTLHQREAAMCLISFFGGFNENLNDDAPMLIFKQAALFFGFQDSQIALSQMMSKFSDSETLIDTVITIKPTKAKEFLLLTCYDLIKSVNKPEAYDVLFGIANDMGYDKTKIQRLIELYR